MKNPFFFRFRAQDERDSQTSPKDALIVITAFSLPWRDPENLIIRGKP